MIMFRSHAWLTNIVPADTTVQDISSLLPDQIIDSIKNLNLKNSRVLVLTNGDVWRYSGNLHLQRFLATLDQIVFIFYLGYTFDKIHDNVFAVPWPFDYFMRNRNGIFYRTDKIRAHAWGCLNNRLALHRLLLGYELDKKNLLSDMVFSQNTIDPENINGFHRVLLDSLPDFAAYESRLPIKYENELLDKKNYKGHDAFCLHDAYADCYAYIVTETECETIYWPGVSVDNPISTEKTWKPLFCGQIPLFLAAKGHLGYLKHLGFEVFEDLVGQDFDHLGLAAKIDRLVALVANGKDFIESFYFDNAQALVHNHALIMSDKVDHLIANETHDFIRLKIEST